MTSRSARALPSVAVPPAPVPFGRGDIEPSVVGTVTFSGYTMACTGSDGSIRLEGRAGLYDFDTRILSRYEWRVDGQPVPFVSATNPDSSRRVITLERRREGGTPDGPRLPRDGCELSIRRRVGRGMLDDVEIRNHSMVASTLEATLDLDADFLESVARESDQRRAGRLQTSWDGEAQVLTFDFTAHHGGRSVHRAARIRLLPGSQRAHCSGKRLTFRLALPARGSGCVRVAVESLVDGAWRSPLDLGPDAASRTERDEAHAEWDRIRTHLDAPHAAQSAFECAAADLHALRLWEADEVGPGTGAGDADAGEPDVGPPRAGEPDPDGQRGGAADAGRAWIPSAGAPLYSGVFGRDILTAGWQSGILGPEVMRGAIEVAARTQASTDDPFRDAEPGKMLHEARRGPLSDLAILPQRAYYGSQTTASMFLIALTELWHWTGDDSVLRRYRGAAERAMEWAERFGDLDGDGFLEYRRRAEHGPRNQGWKDSDDAIRYPDGRQVPNPIATVEEQAFHFLALQRMAELLVALGEDHRAGELLERARNLAARWHDAYFMPDAGFYALALDPGKEQVRSIASNPGHALGAGIVPREHARRVADRLMEPDLFSGWGVRTLSREHPSYNPFSYHLGSVWPVENATFALGFKRYGFDDLVERLVDAQFRAASQFRHHRLPEAISGHGADERMAPSVYPAANAPQAWNASATTQLVQILLGLYPFAPLRMLAIVRPRLPEWLPAVTLRNLRVGDARLSIRFERESDGSAHHQVLERHGTVHLLPAPPPTAEPEGLADSVKRWAIEHAPGRQMRALRIAMGAE